MIPLLVQAIMAWQNTYVAGISHTTAVREKAPESVSGALGILGLSQ